MKLENLEQLAIAAGMESALDMGAASCVWSDGCDGVAQSHLERFRSLAEQQAEARIIETMRKFLCDHPNGSAIALFAAVSPSATPTESDLDWARSNVDFSGSTPLYGGGSAGK